MKLNILKWIGNLLKDPRKRIKQAVTITQILKKAIDSKVGDTFVSLFPGEWDNKLRDKMSRKLTEALRALELIDNLTYVPSELRAALKGSNRANWLKLIAAKIAEQDLGIDTDSALAQTQLVYGTDPEFA